MKIKTSLYIEKSVWREIKKAAIDAGQTVKYRELKEHFPEVAREV